MRLTILSVCLCIPCAALAEPAAPGEPAAHAYAFEDELVKGDLVRTDTELLHARRRSGRASLITVRDSYLPELLASVEDL
jgi:hypothetical protein